MATPADTTYSTPSGPSYSAYYVCPKSISSNFDQVYIKNYRHSHNNTNIIIFILEYIFILYLLDIIDANNF